MTASILCRDISGILLGLSKEFNIKRFMAVLLDSLLLYRCISNTFLSFLSRWVYFVSIHVLTYCNLVCSSSDDQCCEALASIIETVPVNNLVDHLIAKVFSLCLTQYQKNSDLTSSKSGA